jgi:hypothetical protein
MPCLLVPWQHLPPLGPPLLQLLLLPAACVQLQLLLLQLLQHPVRLRLPLLSARGVQQPLPPLLLPPPPPLLLLLPLVGLDELPAASGLQHQHHQTHPLLQPPPPLLLLAAQGPAAGMQQQPEGWST